MGIFNKRDLTEDSLELTEKLIDYEVETYLIRRRGYGMDGKVIVKEVQEIMDSMFKPEIAVKVELDKLSGVCIVIHSYEFQFEDVIKYIGKQIKEKDE